MVHTHLLKCSVLHPHVVGVSLTFLLGWGNLGNVLNNKGLIKEAAEAYRNALHHRPNMADAHYN